MCGRFTLTHDMDELQQRFGIEGGELAHQPRFNVAPTQPVLTVVNEGGNRAHVMRWGLISYRSKGPGAGARMINARVEKPIFRMALQRRRCFVLADGFYEWRSTGGPRTPVYVALKSRAPFAMAGIWDTWKSPTGEAMRSCAIVNTASNVLVERIHDRMPVILRPEVEAAWLDREIDDPLELTTLLTSYPAEEMEAYEVSTLVNSPANDAPDCFLPAGESGPRQGALSL